MFFLTGFDVMTNCFYCSHLNSKHSFMANHGVIKTACGDCEGGFCKI